MTGKRWNELIHMLNLKIPASQAGKLTKEEAKVYNNMWSEAEAHEKEYGKWPIFDNVEIETDDSCLDIYKQTG